jgi:hypothetical protein
LDDDAWLSERDGARVTASPCWTGSDWGIPTNVPDPSRGFVCSVRVPAAFASREIDAGAGLRFREPLVEPVEAEAPRALASAPTTRRQLVVVDPTVEGSETLLAHLVERAGSPTEVLVLDTDRDGIAQISEAMSGLSDVEAVHLVSHGADGALKLGGAWLSSANLESHAGRVAAWSEALTSDADLLLYGCDVAASDDGRGLVSALASLTGADVAASANPTGNARLGGDWNLEFQVGAVQAGVAFDQDAQAHWMGVLGTVTVTTVADVVNGDVSSLANLIATNGGDGVSLREAILATNSTPGADVVNLPSGTYVFAIAGRGENAGTTGDLDIDDALTIVGAGSGLSTIDANGLDRVFEVRPGVAVTLSDITLRGGMTPSSGLGGGVLIFGGASLNLSRVVTTGNNAGSGAALYNDGTLIATDSTFSGNAAADWAGGLYNDRGVMSLDRVTIHGNSAGKDGAGIYNSGSGATLSLVNVTISGNTAAGEGGGLWTNQTVTATNVTIAFNSANDGDGVYTQGGNGTVKLKNSVLDNPAGVNARRALISLGHNLDTDGTAALTGPGDLVAASRLDPILADHGGFAPTHRPLVGSPAIGAGTSAGAPAVDARGFERLDGRPDLGALEVNAQSLDTIYWVDQQNDNIQRSDLDGSNVQTVLSSANGVNSPTGLLVDTVNGKIYWSEYSSGNIKRANLDGSNIQTLYSGLSSPGPRTRCFSEPTGFVGPT